MCKGINPFNQLKEPELIRLIKQGNQDAFKVIYEKYWKKLYGVALLRMTRADAKDIVQEVFISLWMKRENLIITNSLSSYLYTAIKYKIINYFESNLVKNNYLNSLHKAAIEFENSTNEIINVKDLEQIIESSNKNLTPKVKEVFELSRNDNLSNHEIAQKLNVSDQTVRNYISIALKSLKIHLRNY